MKKVITLLLVIILAFTFITPAFAAPKNTESDGPTIVLTRTAAPEIIELKTHQLTYEINFIPPTSTILPTALPTNTPSPIPTVTTIPTTTATIPKRIILIKNYQDPSIQELIFDSIAKTYYSTQTEDFDAEFKDYRPKVDIYHINFDSKKSLEKQFGNALKNDGHLKYIVFLDENNTRNEDILKNIKPKIDFKPETYNILHYNILNYNILDLAKKDPGLYKNVADIIKYGLPENIQENAKNTSQPTSVITSTSTPIPTVTPTETPTFEFEEVLPVEVKTAKSNNPNLNITKNAEGRFVVKGELDVATINFTIDVTYHYRYSKVTYNDKNSRLTVNSAGQAYIEHFNGLTVNIKHIIDVQ